MCSPHFSNPEIGAAFSPSKDTALVCLRGSPQRLTALQLPILSQRYSMGAEVMHNADLQPCWAACTPNGCHFAVVWAHAHEAAKELAMVQLLRIHTSRNGAWQAQLDARHILPVMRMHLAPRPHSMPFAWSHTSSCMSTLCGFSPQLNSPEAGAHAILHVGGSLNPLLQLPAPECKAPHDACHASWWWLHCGLFFS